MSKTLILQIPVIAITGSAGKTTTKEMIASILSRRYTILKSRQNMNMISNTKQYRKQLKPAHRAMVLEYGMLRAGHIRSHCQVIQPNIGVITNVGTAHIGNFNGKKSGIARAKSELIQYMNQAGTLFINADDKHSKLLSTDQFKGKIYRIGTSTGADYQAYNIRYGDLGQTFSMKLNGKPHNFFVPIHGEHNIYNALFAVAVCHRLGCSPQLIARGLRHFPKPMRRLATFRYKNGIKVIDDTYSANPHAMKAAIDVLSTIGRETNVAVLGDMLEMGKYSRKGHRRVGRYIVGKKVHYIYTIGNNARHIGDGAVQAGFPASRVFHCNGIETLHGLLMRRIKPNTAFLIKGSHKMRMNRTTAFIKRKAERLSRS